MRRVALVIAVTLLVVICTAAYAFAHDEMRNYDPDDNCSPQCHFGGTYPRSGPHGGYLAATKKCGLCHDMHGTNQPSVKLLPKDTITASCEMCHDGTGGKGVYGTIVARGLTPGARHRIDATNVVPGGDPVTAEETVTVFRGPGGLLGCDDCHTPHGASIVASFTGERVRAGSSWDFTFSSRILKQKPTGATTATAVYGSDWCLGCHKGRGSGMMGRYNHPVDSTLVTTTPFYYENVAVLTQTATQTSYFKDYWPQTETGTVVAGRLGGNNRGYLMPVPRKAAQQGHSPICQQCHEDSRNVGTLVDDGDTAIAGRFIQGNDGAQGMPGTMNPQFQNFPHETINRRFLLEDGDDLCLNCHNQTVLP